MRAASRHALSLPAWKAATTKQRRELASTLARDALTFVRLQSKAALELPVYMHASGVQLQLVPGGTYKLGFCDEEWQQLEAQYMGWPDAVAVDGHLGSKALRPTIEVTLEPFLLASAPLGKGKPPNYKRVKKLPARDYLKYLETSNGGNLETLRDVDRVEKQLRSVGLRLPSEAEWEAAARGGVYPRPFPSGHVIPEQPGVGANPFGLVDLGAESEVCADRWTPSRKSASRSGRAVAKGKGRVLRGGAANIYPWQGCGEWTLLLCAMRTNAAADDGGFFTIRPAMSLE